MSLANRPTTEEEGLRLRRFGFQHSSLESLYGGNWIHPRWTPDGHVGPDEALALCAKHENLLVSRPATPEEAEQLRAGGFSASPYSSSRHDWFQRSEVQGRKVEPSDCIATGLALALVPLPEKVPQT